MCQCAQKSAIGKSKDNKAEETKSVGLFAGLENESNVKFLDSGQNSGNV